MNSEDWEERHREKGDKRKSNRSDKIQYRLDKEKKKEDAPYLNSTSRVTKKFAISILEFIAIFILISIITTYMDTGTLDITAIPGTVMEYLQPGGVILTALIAFLPILILENIGVYYGLGTYPRMLFGIVKCLAMMLWFEAVLGSFGDIDLVKLVPLSEESLDGLVSLTINIGPISNIVIFILLLCCIIPVFEFIGCRRKHHAAMRHVRERRQHRKEKINRRKGEIVSYDYIEDDEPEEERKSEDESDGKKSE